MTEEILFPNLVWRSRYEWDLGSMLPVCNRLINGSTIKTALGQGDTGSSVNNKHEQPHTSVEFQDYYNWLSGELDTILFKKWSMMDIQFGCLSSWVNYQDYGSLTESHIHRGVPLTTIAYMNVPNNSGYLELADPLESFWRLQPKKSVSKGWYKIPISSGDVIMFPGWIEHRTEKHTGTKGQLRWALVSNIAPLTKVT